MTYRKYIVIQLAGLTMYLFGSFWFSFGGMILCFAVFALNYERVMGWATHRDERGRFVSRHNKLKWWL